MSSETASSAQAPEDRELKTLIGLNFPKFKVPKKYGKHAKWFSLNRSRITITMSVFFAVFLLFQFDLLRRFELVTYDYRNIVRGERNSDPSIIVIEISDDSIEKIGRWPWDRSWHAAIIQALTELGAKAIVFDVIFSETSKPQHDEALAQAVKASKIVYLAEVVENADSITKKNVLLASIAPVREGAKGAGHINLQPDVDGVMRRMRPFMKVGEANVPQLSLAVAADEMGLDLAAVSESPGVTVIPYLDKQKAPLRIPLDASGNMILNWAGLWRKTFAHYSYIDVISSYASRKKGAGGGESVHLDSLKGKICFIGSTATGLFDIRPTPLEPAYPAVGVNMNVMQNLLERKFIHRLGYGKELLLLVFLTVLMFRVMKIQSFARQGIAVVSVIVGYILTALLLFLKFDLWINLIYPLLLAALVYFFSTLYNQLSIAIEKAKLMKLATRDSLTGLFNIGHFKLLLTAEMTTISLRREKNLSIVMGDVDNFKRTNDTYGHLTGDAVLREVASQVRSNCRALDVAARYGGEEFILMLPGANVDQAFKVAENIRKSVANKVFFHEKGDFRTSISIGVTQVSPDDPDIESIVARADKALYEAKHTGKNKVVIASDSPKFNVEQP